MLNQMKSRGNNTDQWNLTDYLLLDCGLSMSTKHMRIFSRQI